MTSPATEPTATPDAAAPDEFEWLEDIHGEAPLAWVAEQNELTSAMLDSPGFHEAERQILEVLDSSDRIPMVSKRGAFYYNFWRDERHPRGLWRRTTPESYRGEDPEWEILLDVDELCRAEDADWVFAGAQTLHPDYRRALLRLSPGGGDAVTIREYDLEAKEFVTDGFALPAAKTSVSWIDADTVFVATDFGDGSMTASSYPRLVKRWRRGTPLETAEPVFEVPADHMTAGMHHDHTEGFERDLLVDVLDFFTSRTYLLADGELTHLEVPDDASLDVHREWLLVRPRTDWATGGTNHPAGSLLAARLEDFLAGTREFEVLFAPDEHTSLEDWSWTRNHLILTLLRDVSSRIEILTPSSSGDSGWARRPLTAAPELHTVSAAGVDADEDDDYWLMVTGFLSPATLMRGTIEPAGSAAASGPETPKTAETLKTAPSFFDESRFEVQQHFATSLDGTRVPYFQVARRGLELDGGNPTLLSGYGGFEVSRVPAYSGSVGRSWLERGGVFVVANIRGGGEYGPAWHLAALKENRHRAYEDFAAVARDLIGRGVTSPAHLGCEGGSNGGLLVGNMLTHYPELFGAIACEVPLLDMRRYTKLSAGASWIAEYGDPDDEEQWEFIRTFSPYHNLKAGTAYPPVLFYTATSDDRVGPVQARKMAAKMQAMGLPGVWFYENLEGGHSAAADNKQSAHLHAAAYEFLMSRLG